MFIQWKVRYISKADKDYKDRWLLVDTDSLEPAAKAAIELVVEATNGTPKRDILPLRKYFREATPGEIPRGTPANPSRVNCFFLIDYFEDDDGNEVSLDEIARIVTGNTNVRVFPSCLSQHDIEYSLSTPQPLPVSEITLTPDDFKLLGYFVRDFRELSGSAFMADGVGTLEWVGTTSTLKTACSDDEIRSFATIFRRLYMTGEPANFSKAVDAFSNALGDHPLAKWVKGVRLEYEKAMANSKLFPFANEGRTTFTAKNLIDVLIYTQYAHQPLGHNERRQDEYDDYLGQLNGDKAKLTWMCLSEIWKSALMISNAGRVIAAWFDRYCQSHQSSADVLASLRIEHPGIGSQEKKADRRARLRHEKLNELAESLWNSSGRPVGGPTLFRAEAERQLDCLFKD